MNLYNQIKQSREIKDISLKNYISALKKVKYTVTGNDNLNENLNWLYDSNTVFDAIEKEKKLTSKRNKLTAIVVALSSEIKPNLLLIDEYKRYIRKLNDIYNDFINKQEKSETQKKNWIEYEKLKSIIKEYKNTVKNYKNELSYEEFDILQQYLILLVYFYYPIRNDFSNMKIITLKEYKDLNDEEKENNYLVIKNKSMYFRINTFKTSDKYGPQIYLINKKVKDLIRKFQMFNKSGYLFVQLDRKTPMTSNNITKYLNKIFNKKVGKNIGSSMLRHIIISHNLKGSKTIKQKMNDEEQIKLKYLHSGKLNDIYRKIN